MTTHLKKTKESNALTNFFEAFECIKDESTKHPNFFWQSSIFKQINFFENFCFVACHEIALTRQGETTHAYQDLKKGGANNFENYILQNYDYDQE